MKKVAFLTLFLFGCSAVRVPVSTLGEPVPAPRGVRIAEPQVELWVEDDDPPTAEEADSALRDARAALAAALEGRGDPAAGDAADTVLYVRERAVARTDARRRDQRLATAGIVVGAVVVVAAVVWSILDGKSSSKGSRRVATATPPRTRTAPAPKPGTAAAPPRVRARPSGGHVHGPDIDVLVGFGIHVPTGPYPAAPAGVNGDVPGPPPAAAGETAPEDDVTDPWEEVPEEEPADPVPALPPAAPLDVEARGFFAGDEVVLDLVLVDRRTGQPIWTRAVRQEIDARDPAAIARAVEAALADQPWARRGAP